MEQIIHLISQMQREQMRCWEGFLIMTIQNVCCFKRQPEGREESSGCRGGRFKESSLSEVANDERH